MKKYLEIFNAILGMQSRFLNQLRVEFEDGSHKEYYAYHFKFDFMVDTFQSFIVIYWDDDNNDTERLLKEIEEIEAKANKLKG